MELFEAVSANDVIKVMQLLQRGVDPNQFDYRHSFNALHFAVEQNAMDVVMLLITAGADMDATTEEELTVYDLAVRHKNEQMLELLLKLAHMRCTHKRYYCH